MKQKQLLTAAFSLFTTLASFAQNFSTITGQIKDNNGNGVAAATVMLHHAKDSALAKTAVSSSTGNYELLAIKPGNYFISTTVAGMVKATSAIIEVKENENATVAAIIVTPATKNLQGVTVTSQKPMIEVRADKTILNVEGTINAVGNDALELLRRSPGVMVDKDDNLSLAGKNGVQVFIDGKPSPLSGSDLANYLKSLQSAQIEAIEIITNPSAKYEAAGNAGIINIVLKKTADEGLNGGYSLNAGYGKREKYGTGGNFNYRKSLLQ